MARQRTDPSQALDPIDEVARLLALNLKRERSLQEVVVELESIGIKQARIAELLGTSPGYVSVALQRARGQEKKRSSPKQSPAAE